MRYVVSDVHGHRDELVEALRSAGLLDAAGHWSGGDATLWVLGDYVDRGPDGVGVVDLVMRLQREAPGSGGRVGALMGNHEVLALGMHRFGDRTVRDAGGREHAFSTSWAMNGGRPATRRGSPPSTWRGWPRSPPSPATGAGCSPTPTRPSTSAGARPCRRSTPRWRP